MSFFPVCTRTSTHVFTQLTERQKNNLLYLEAMRLCATTLINNLLPVRQEASRAISYCSACGVVRAVSCSSCSLLQVLDPALLLMLKRTERHKAVWFQACLSLMEFCSDYRTVAPATYVNTDQDTTPTCQPQHPSRTPPQHHTRAQTELSATPSAFKHDIGHDTIITILFMSFTS